MKRKYENHTDIEWEGVVYDTIADAAKAAGVKYDCMLQRYKKGYTCEADLKVIPTVAVYIPENGKTYESIGAAWRGECVSHSTMYQWLRTGRAVRVSDIDKEYSQE